MTITGRLVSAVALGLALTRAACAADLPVKAAALPPAPAFDWSGIYVGVHAGYGGGMKDWPSGFGPGTDYAAGGFLAGGQVGINKQIASLVFGLELDGSWANIRGSQFMRLEEPFFIDSAGTVTSRIDALATVAGRAGLAADRWFVFAKGGIAGAWEKHSTNGASNDPFFGTSSTSSLSGNEYRWGPMIGLGAEYALAGNWSVKAEYDYIHFGTRTATLNGSTTSLGVTTPITTNVSITQDSIHLLKIGANYRIADVGVDSKFPPVKAASGTNWTGAFVGVQGAYGFGREWRAPVPAPIPQSGTFDLNGWLGGFDGGVNVQSGVFVVGVEGEWMWTGVKGSRSSTFPIGGTTFTTDLNTSVDWLAIVSGRAGFVVGDRLLAYGKAGIAIANQSHAMNGIGTAGAASEALVVEGKAVHSGGVLGAGLEYALAGNWSVKAEYDYIRMMNQQVSQSGTFSAPLFPPAAAATNSSITQDLHLFKLGVNYHINPARL
jgi:opacity protein-like surface antigen